MEADAPAKDAEVLGGGDGEAVPIMPYDLQ
jgi:hypothetical protein